MRRTSPIQHRSISNKSKAAVDPEVLELRHLASGVRNASGEARSNSIGSAKRDRRINQLTAVALQPALGCSVAKSSQGQALVEAACVDE